MKQSKFYQALKTRQFNQGEFIFKEGDQGDFAYIVEKGEIQILTEISGKQTILNVLGPGSLFGEIALIDGRCRSASARASKPTLLTIITQEQIKLRLQAADPILQMLLLTVMSYFRSASNYSRFLQANTQADEFIVDSTTQVSEGISLAVDLIRMESELRTAIDEEQLQLYYQPIVNLSTNIIAGFEVLLRWQSPTRGSVRPDVFIALAESTSLIIPMGQWVIEQALQALPIIQQKSQADLFISINIANRQIEDPGFLKWLVELIEQENINPNYLKLEMLERSLLSGETPKEWVRCCREYGFPIVLDDFGTGYSSLSYLINYNFDTLKIDKSFVQNLDENPQSYNVCRTIIELAKLLNMTVVAEGIEKSIQAEILRDLNCTFGQGYYFSKPLSLEGAIAILESK